MNCALWSIFLALAHTIPAQRHAVIPHEAATREGAGADQSPFGRDRQRYVQYVHRNLLGDVPVGVAIHAIAYRREGGDDRRPTQRRVLPGEAIQRPAWAVRLGNPVVDVRDPPREYPALHDPAWTLVRDPNEMTFPDLDLPPSGLPGFDLVFPFDRPFIHRGGELGVEHYVDHRRQISYGYVVDAIDARTEQGTGATIVELSPARVAAAVPGPGGTLSLSIHGLAAGTRAALALWPLVDDAPEAMPSASAAFEVPVRTDGGASFQFTLPLDDRFSGRRLDAEWWIHDGGGMRRIAHQRLTFGRLVHPSAPLMSVVAGFPESHVRHGFVQRARGPVFQLRW